MATTGLVMSRTNLWNDPAHWRARGEEMRVLAEGVSDLKAKKRMLKMAEEYDKLAQRAEERAANHPSQYDAQLPQKQNALGRPKTQQAKKVPRIPDADEFRNALMKLPILTVQRGETVLTAGSTTGQLFVLRQGAVEVLRDGIQIARVSDSGAIFGELAALLNKPHTADVKALEQSEFSVADAKTLLAESPTTLLYVAALLARRLDSANTVLLELKRQLRANDSYIEITQSVADLEKLLSGNLDYASYPYNPFAVSARH
jgi:CRP/FNR family transcriptional regulator, cyclic AMP receptor protein